MGKLKFSVGCLFFAMIGVLLFSDAALANPRALPLTNDGGRVARVFSSIFDGNGDSRVIAEAARYTGAANITGTKGPWCADYVSFVLRKTGHRPLANRMANAALAYGQHVRNPHPGDLVVIATRGGHATHVGFFAGFSGNQVVLISGNWHHRVSRAYVSRAVVDAFVRV